jgi:hypothetical protein
MTEFEDLGRRLFSAADQNGVGAGLRIRDAPPQRPVLAQTGDQCLGPCHHQRAAGKPGGLDLALELLERHQYLPPAGSQAAVLWERLVLDDNRSDAGGRVARHQIGDVDRIAVAGVVSAMTGASCASPIARISAR